MLKLIKVTTFKAGCNAGMVRELGEYNLPVRQYAKLPEQDGCLSASIKLDEVGSTEQYAVVGDRMYRIGSNNLIRIPADQIDKLPDRNVKLRQPGTDIVFEADGYLQVRLPNGNWLLIQCGVDSLYLYLSDKSRPEDLLKVCRLCSAGVLLINNAREFSELLRGLRFEDSFTKQENA